MNPKDIFIREKLQSTFKLSLRRVLMFYAFVQIMSLSTDYSISPDNIKQFFFQRAGLIVFIVLTLFLLKKYQKWPMRFYYLILFMSIVIFMLVLDIRIYETGGHESQYYMGMLLLGILFIGFIPARWVIHLITALLLYGTYIIPIIVYDEILNKKDFMLIHIYILIMFSILLFIKILSLKKLKADIELQYELIMHKEHLEELVDSRTQEIRKSLKEKSALLAEIHHRVKNNLALIISLLSLQSSKAKMSETSEMLMETTSRIKSMALIHENLYSAVDFTDIDFADYLSSLVNTIINSLKLTESKVSVDIDIDKDMTFTVDLAVPMGLLLNELLMNAMKHAFPEGAKGTIHISLTKINDDAAKLVFADNGIGIPDGINIKEPDTLGFQIINTLVKQLNGELTIERHNVTKFTVIIDKTGYTRRH